MNGLTLISHIALWLLVLTNFVLVLLLYRHFGLMSLGTLEGVQRDGLAIGDPTTPIIGIRPNGADGSWEPSRGRPSFLLFAAPDCEPCRTVFPDVNALARDADIEVAVVTDGPRAQAQALAEHVTSTQITVLADDASGAFANYRVRVTPFAFIIGRNGRVQAKGLCNDTLRVRQLLDAAGLEGLVQAVGAERLAAMNGQEHG
jgi:methylamine dehydrogenase accessory protein MauD